MPGQRRHLPELLGAVDAAGERPAVLAGEQRGDERLVAFGRQRSARPWRPSAPPDPAGSRGRPSGACRCRSASPASPASWSRREGGAVGAGEGEILDDRDLGVRLADAPLGRAGGRRRPGGRAGATLQAAATADGGGSGDWRAPEVGRRARMEPSICPAVHRSSPGERVEGSLRLSTARPSEPARREARRRGKRRDGRLGRRQASRRAGCGAGGAAVARHGASWMKRSRSTGGPPEMRVDPADNSPRDAAAPSRPARRRRSSACRGAAGAARSRRRAPGRRSPPSRPAPAPSAGRASRKAGRVRPGTSAPSGRGP